MENLNETIQFLIQSLQTYTGNNPIWILYPVAMILIWFLGKKGDRKLFIGVFVTECLTIFNPFVVKVLLDVFGFGTRFVRFLWIIVFFITIGYALTLLIFASAKTSCKNGDSSSACQRKSATKIVRTSGFTPIYACFWSFQTHYGAFL